MNSETYQKVSRMFENSQTVPYFASAVSYLIKTTTTNIRKGLSNPLVVSQNKCIVNIF